MTVTLIIVILTSLVSFRCFSDQQLLHKLKHYPVQEHSKKEYYRLLTSGFVHGDWMHLIFNMYVLYTFGEIIEYIFTETFGLLLGSVIYVGMYLILLVLSDLPTFFKHKNNPNYSSIGASGAVSGILFSFILFDPWRMLYLFFAIPIPAIVFAVLYLIYSSWANKNAHSRIDHSAHFMGAISGVVLTIIIYPKVIQLFVENIKNIPSFF